jgi:UDP-N-acetylglucosamine--N-acetylmuramyl-(pentapeptide) pyrophosphoryl-undecaprenol N-acetylglucosamine transferase
MCGQGMGEPLRVLIAGGGTGGHLYPGLAVARFLVETSPEATVTFAGTAKGLEARVVPREGFALDTIRSAGLKGKSPLALARGVGLLPLSAIDAWRVLSRRRPHVVVGVGGYSSGPVVLLAALRGISTLLLEQNAVPGFANRRLARLVTAAAVTYEETLEWFGRRGFVSGNPVRAGFLAIGAADPWHRAERRVLVFGGSQGARAINDAMAGAAPVLARSGLPLRIVHQTGERDVARLEAAYAAAGIEARVAPYLERMDEEMAWADLIVSRAGATTLAEVTAAGRLALLVPLPTATDDHQRRNAEALVRSGAAAMIEQRHLTPERLAGEIIALARDDERRIEMGRRARERARPDAAQLIADRIRQLARRA